MTYNAGFATLSVIPSLRGFSAAMDGQLQAPMARAGQQAGETAGNSFHSSFLGKVGTAAKVAGATLIAGLGAAGVAAGVWGLKTAAANEQAQIAFEGMLGSAEEAQGFIAQMKDFAARTPFELPGLQTAARQLLGVGFSVEKVLPTLDTIGNVASALGVSSDGITSVVRALGQMRGKGKASAEELQQISEALPGFSAIGAIAKKMGISTADAFDLMAKGAIPADDAIQAVLDGMADFPGAAGAMERQGKTLNGLMSTLGDTLSQGLASAVQPFLPSLKRVVEGATSFIGDMSAAFERGGLGEVWNELRRKWDQAWPETIQPALGTLWNNLTTWIGDRARELPGQALGLARGLIDWAGGIWEGTPDSPGLKTKLGEAWDNFTAWIETQRQELPGKVAGLREAFTGWASGVWDGEAGGGGPSSPGMRQQLDSAFGNLGSWIDGQRPALEDNVRNAWPQAMANGLGTLWDNLANATVAALNSFSSWLDNGGAEGLINAGINIAKGVAYGAYQLATFLEQAFVDTIVRFGQWVIENGPRLFGAFFQLGQSLGRFISNGLENALGNLGAGAVKGLINSIPIVGPLAQLSGITDLFRANGGPVAAGRPHIVGEEGPEWFVPKVAGTILPNGVAPQVDSPVGRGGMTVGDIIIGRSEDRKIAKDVVFELRAASLTGLAA